jgi:hypothetical protein
MDSVILTDLSLILAGIVYFLVYKLVIAKVLKLKLIHSIWIPLIYGLGVSIFVISLLQTPWFGPNRSLWNQIWTVMEVNLPVLSYLILFGLFMRIEEKPLK